MEDILAYLKWSLYFFLRDVERVPVTEEGPFFWRTGYEEYETLIFWKLRILPNKIQESNHNLCFANDPYQATYRMEIFYRVNSCFSPAKDIDNFQTSFA
jgi:hypothetical protein